MFPEIFRGFFESFLKVLGKFSESFWKVFGTFPRSSGFFDFFIIYFFDTRGDFLKDTKFKITDFLNQIFRLIYLLLGSVPHPIISDSILHFHRAIHPELVWNISELCRDFAELNSINSDNYVQPAKHHESNSDVTI